MEASPCTVFRGQALARARELDGHAETCAPCARWLRGLAARERLLAGLPRASAPAELDGRVVAAIHAGERQERAVDALRGLGRLEVGPGVERALAEAAESAAVAPLEAPGRRRAPRVLERLVAGELADPGRARAQRFVSSLPRLGAPPELELAVRAELARPRRPHLARSGLWWSAAVAAALIAASTLPRLRREPRYPFRVEQASRAELEPAFRTLIDATSGGMLSLNKI
jgi:hypothetical protein